MVVGECAEETGMCERTQWRGPKQVWRDHLRDEMKVVTVEMEEDDLERDVGGVRDRTCRQSK